jgi:hypothetical protein
MAAPDGSDFQELLRLRRAGVDPNLIRTLGPAGAERAFQLGGQIREGGMRAVSAAGQRPGMTGTLGATALLAGGNLLQQDPMGAVASTVGGLAGGGVGSLAAGLLPGPLKPVGRFALPAIGGLIGGMGAEQAAKGFAGKAKEAAQRPGAGSDVTIPGTNIPLTETAATRQQREFDRAQTIQDIQQLGGAQLALNKELLGYMMTQEVEQAKAMAPVIERAQRAQLTNAQAMLSSQTAAYQQLGRTAMMGNLAAIGQRERGATMRQALATNPYIGATLQAPSISFG